MIEAQLKALESRRDALATAIKNELWAAEFSGAPITLGVATAQTIQANALIRLAQQLAAS